HNTIHRPGMESIVQECGAHRFQNSCVRLRISGRRCYEVRYRFRRSVEDETDTHACTEQHGKPGNRPEFRFIIRFPQFQLTDRAEHQENAEEYQPKYSVTQAEIETEMSPNWFGNMAPSTTSIPTMTAEYVKTLETVRLRSFVLLFIISPLNWMSQSYRTFIK